MMQENIYKIIAIDEHSITPKYMQLVNSILKGIEDKKILKNDILPSINELSYEMEISRDTGEKAYKYLKNLGIVHSVPGKGYFIGQTDFKKRVKIFLLF